MGEGDKNKEWEFHLRSLSSGARDSNAAVDLSLLNSVCLYFSLSVYIYVYVRSILTYVCLWLGCIQVKRLCELCKEEKPEELIVRVYPHLNRIFQRAVASISQSQTSCGLLLLVNFFPNFTLIVLWVCLFSDDNEVNAPPQGGVVYVAWTLHLAGTMVSPIF